MKQRVLSFALCGLMLLAGCRSETVQEEIWELEQEDAVTFPDGVSADRWRGYRGGLREAFACYELSDGTVLLIEDDPAGPEGSGYYQTLSEEVQAAVLAWSQGEGERYDLPALAAACYARWQEQGGDDFEPGRVSQYTAATALAERAVYLTTTVDQAADPAQGTSLRYGVVFDRETGQKLDVWSLFTKGEAEARLALASAVGDEPAVRDTLAPLIDPEKILFFEEHLEVEFPAGTLDGLDTAYILAVDYAALDGLLAAWALPGGGAAP